MLLILSTDKKLVDSKVSYGMVYVFISCLGCPCHSVGLNYPITKISKKLFRVIVGALIKNQVPSNVTPVTNIFHMRCKKIKSRDFLKTLSFTNNQKIRLQEQSLSHNFLLCSSFSIL